MLPIVAQNMPPKPWYKGPKVSNIQPPVGAYLGRVREAWMNVTDGEDRITIEIHVFESTKHGVLAHKISFHRGNTSERMRTRP